MKKDELISMFKYSSMIKSLAFTAAVFSFLAVLFKNSIVLVPEATEVRLCNVIACSFGIWFGPAGAIGCAVGNLVGDFGGSLTVLSYYGFLGNFLSAYLPYKIWCVTGTIFGEDPCMPPSYKSKHWVLRYILCGFGSVISCSAVLAIAFDIHGFTPAANTFLMIFLNNTGATFLGFFLFMLGFAIIPRTNFYWRLQMVGEKEYYFSARNKSRLVALLVFAIGVAVGIFVYIYTNGLSLKIMDDFGNYKILDLCAIFSILQIAIFLSCYWRKKDKDYNPNVISLD